MWQYPMIDVSALAKAVGMEEAFEYIVSLAMMTNEAFACLCLILVFQLHSRIICTRSG